MKTALTRLRRRIRFTIGRMHHFTPRLIIATVLAVSFAAIPATGLAAITAPPAATICSHVTANCTATGPNPGGAQSPSQSSPSGSNQSSSGSSCSGFVVFSVTCDIGKVMGFLTGMVQSFLYPNLILSRLLVFLSKLLVLPFAFSSSFFAWSSSAAITPMISSLYFALAGIGAVVAIVAAAARVTKTMYERKMPPNVTVVSDAIFRMVLAIGVMLVFEPFALGLMNGINAIAPGLFNSIDSKGFSSVISNHGQVLGPVIAHFVVQTSIGLYAIAFIIGLVAVFLTMLWMTWLLLMRSATLMLGTIFAPVVFGLAVYEWRLQPVQFWFKLYMSSLFSILVAAIGLGITFAVTGGSLMSTNPISAIMAIVFLIGGIIMTGKIMTMAHGGTGGAMGMMAVGAGAMGAISMVGGVAGGALAGAGVAAGSTIAQATSSFGSLLGAGAGGAMALGGAAPAAASLALSRMHGQPPPSGPLAHAPLQQQAGFAGHDEAVKTVFENDPTLHQAVVTATGHMSPNTPFEARMNEFSSNPVYKTVARRGMAGPHMAHIARGVDPTTIRTAFSPTAQHNLMESAHAAAAKMAAKVVPE